MRVLQARPASSADQSRSLPRLLGFRAARRPVYTVDTVTEPHLLFRGAHGLLRRLLRRFKALCRRPESAPREPLLSAKEREPLSAAPSVTEARASGAAPLSYGIIQATGACASGSAPLSLDTGACALSAAPLSHAPRSSQTAAPARRSFQRVGNEAVDSVLSDSRCFIRR